MPIARVLVRVVCSVRSGDEEVGKRTLVFTTASSSEVRGKLQDELQERLKLDDLKFPHLREFKITRLQTLFAVVRDPEQGARSGHRRQAVTRRDDPLAAEQPGQVAAVWPPNWLAVQATATVQASQPSLPEEVPVRVRHFPTWPASVFLPAHHRVRCGCGTCTQADAADVDGSGQQQQQQWRRRKSPYCQDRGFWSPTAFIQHVADADLRGRRQPPGVPRLRSGLWLTFELEPYPGEEPVQLGLTEVTELFGISWQPRKPIPQL